MAGGRKARRDGSGGALQGCPAGPPPSLLCLPAELLLGIARLLPQSERIAFTSLSRQLYQLSLGGGALWADLHVDLGWLVPGFAHPGISQHLQHSLRMWVQRRRHGVVSLRLDFLDHHNLESNLCLLPLVAALAGELSGAGLRRLTYSFTCDTPWLDALLPLGPCSLEELAILECHLDHVPLPLPSLAPSLTSLALSLCEGFASHAGSQPEGLAQAVAALTGLQSLALNRVLREEVPPSFSVLTRLTSLDLAGSWVPSVEDELLPPCLSTLMRLARLDLSDCSMLFLPGVVQHFTGLRTLLTSGNRLGYNGEDMLEEEASPQGVPLALSALSQLEELRLDCNRDLDQLPQAFTGLTRLTRLMVGGTPLPPGPYLGNLQELSLAFALQTVEVPPVHAASRLRRLSFRGQHAVSRGGCGELLAEVAELRCLTYLDIGHLQIARLPAGPYAQGLQELAAAHAARHSTGLMSSLPALPALRRLDWMGNKRVGVGPLRHLLDRAPRLQVLYIRREGLTATGFRMLREAQLELDPSMGQLSF